MIRNQLRDLSIAPGDVVLMHSSMKALETELTPEDFLLELMDALTNAGTLLLPALTYESVTLEHPYFTVTESEPCVGVLPKTFMKMRGVQRSMHPTHSVFAWGANADALTREHIKDNTPVGPFSPFMLLPGFDGKILFVGDILHSCTFMHGIEEIVKAPYVMNKDMTKYTLTDAKGITVNKDYYTHNFKGWEQEYPRIRDILKYPDIRTGFICAAPCTLINPKKLKTAAIERFHEDIYAFVSPVL
ncbi:MAG: AAC(3) family N-acetyltransferase [Oscillospiraceae bacterium]|nr:AAC(3) family N-acetyltransferase [Oscillospiraceae bacterium]